MLGMPSVGYIKAQMWAVLTASPLKPNESSVLCVLFSLSATMVVSLPVMILLVRALLSCTASHPRIYHVTNICYRTRLLEEFQNPVAALRNSSGFSVWWLNTFFGLAVITTWDGDSTRFQTCSLKHGDHCSYAVSVPDSIASCLACIYPGVASPSVKDHPTGRGCKARVTQWGMAADLEPRMLLCNPVHEVTDGEGAARRQTSCTGHFA